MLLAVVRVLLCYFYYGSQVEPYTTTFVISKWGDLPIYQIWKRESTYLGVDEVFVDQKWTAFQTLDWKNDQIWSVKFGEDS